MKSDLSDQLDQPQTILVLEGADVTAYVSLAEAIAWMEAVDVIEHAYVVYDASGRRLLLNADSFDGPIYLDAVLAGQDHIDELHAALTHRLGENVAGPPTAEGELPASRDLASLVATVPFGGRRDSLETKP